eukprot:Opistho-2@16728
MAAPGHTLGQSGPPATPQSNHTDTNTNANANNGGDDAAEECIDCVNPISPSEVVLLARIGRGSFGDVYKAQWRGRVVAAKRVEKDCVTSEEQVLSRLDHRNIIRYHGSFARDNDRFIITDYAELGSLFNYLQVPDVSVNTKTIIAWARQIAEGMLYLHGQNIVHRDLKSPNVLVCCAPDGHEGLVMKICDFGASRFVPNSVYMSFAGTPSWCAPEILRGQKASVRSDVHSFGVVLWELLTREVPFKDFDQRAIMYLVGSQTHTLPIPTGCPRAFESLMLRCWLYPPPKRPTFVEILAELEAMSAEQSLEDATASFIASKCTWLPAVSDELRRLLQMERGLRERERIVEEKEKQLKVLEMRLKNQSFGMPTAHAPAHARGHIHSNLNHHNPHRPIGVSGANELDGRPRQVERWTEDGVISWVEALPGHLASYAPAFRANNICGTRLCRMDDATLREMGITSLGHRDALTRAIKDLIHSMQFPPLRSPASPQKRGATQPPSVHPPPHSKASAPPPAPATGPAPLSRAESHPPQQTATAGKDSSGSRTASDKKGGRRRGGSRTSLSTTASNGGSAKSLSSSTASAGSSTTNPAPAPAPAAAHAAAAGRAALSGGVEDGQISVKLFFGSVSSADGSWRCFVETNDGLTGEYVRDVEFVPDGAISGVLVAAAPFEYAASGAPPASIDCRVRFREYFQKKVKRHALRLRSDGTSATAVEDVTLIPR